MTEATNRPTLPVSAGPSDDSPTSYGSVSYWAIGGFIIGVAYAVMMTICVVIALCNRTPWILPLWSLVFPLGAVVICWAARVRIYNSEGALTGATLTTWGLWLSLSIGLVYSAYYSACYLSVTQMATAFADGWFENLKKDEIELAFLKTLPPPRPAADAHLRDRLELDHDSGPEGRGAFTVFRQSQLVRQVEQGGTAGQVQLLGVQSWGYDQAAYQVQVIYRVITPALTSEVLANVVGVDNVDESGGRQWYIKNVRPNGPPILTDEGRRITQLSEEARAFAQNWLDEVSNWNWEKAYLDTLSPAERKEPRGKKFEAFRQGALVADDSGKFWASPKEKDKIIKEVRGIFGSGKDPDDFSLQPIVPLYHRDAEQVVFRYDLFILLPPEYGVQGQVVVTADARNGDPAPGDWRIEKIELFSGKSLTASDPGPGGTAARTPRRPH